MSRDRILLLLEHRGNRRLLAAWLGATYDAVEGDGAEALKQRFDLCIIDGLMLTRLLDADHVPLRLTRIARRGPYYQVAIWPG